MTEEDFTELLISKIFHDLASPVTAISNGVEFITEAVDENFAKKALALIESSSHELVRKVNIYRFMYGKAMLDGEIDFAVVKQLVNELFESSKIHLKWPKYCAESTVISLTSLSSRLMVNLIYLAASTLVAGGEIGIEMQKTNLSKCIHITAIGERLKVANYIVPILKNEKKHRITYENVQVHLIAKLAKELMVDIDIKIGDHMLSLGVEI